MTQYSVLLRCWRRPLRLVSAAHHIYTLEAPDSLATFQPYSTASWETWLQCATCWSSVFLHITTSQNRTYMHVTAAFRAISAKSLAGNYKVGRSSLSWTGFFTSTTGKLVSVSVSFYLFMVAFNVIEHLRMAFLIWASVHSRSLIILSPPSWS